MPNQFFIISGPSGVGKDTLLRMLKDQYSDELVESVSATTRAPRPGEVDGVHYHFMTREKFEADVEAGRFLESAPYGSNLYGTPLAPLEKQLETHNVAAIVEVKGAMQIIEKRPETISIWIAPPSIEVLEQRLRERGTETEEQIQKRLETAQFEMSFAPRYRYRIVNGDLGPTYSQLESLYRIKTRFA